MEKTEKVRANKANKKNPLRREKSKEKVGKIRRAHVYSYSNGNKRKLFVRLKVIPTE